MTDIYRKTQTGKPVNEGEGNRTAGRNFDAAEALFAKSGKVQAKAREAERAVDGAEGPELAKAEAAGKAGPRHAAKPGPAKR
jgi:hypothetical protein